MLGIYICEDNQLQKEKIESYISNYLMIMDYDSKLILSTTNPTEILDSIKKDQYESLFFLDVDLNSEINGIELGAQIKSIIPNARIVFITSHTELTYLTFVYKVEALDFITKSNIVDLKQKILDCLDVAMDRYQNSIPHNEETFSIRCNEVMMKIISSSVLFFETTSVPHKLKLNCRNRIINFYGNIKDCEEFSNYFVRCHKSFVVNINNIERINKQQRLAIMKDGQECPISTRFMRTISEKFEKRS